MKKLLAVLILAAGALAAHGQPAITAWGLNGTTPTAFQAGAGPAVLGPPPSSTLYGYNATGVQPGATYTGGISATGNPGQTCTITIAGGTTAAVGTVTLSTINGVPSPAVIAFNGPGLTVGTGYASPPTSGTASNGTATCSGGVSISAYLGAYVAIQVSSGGGITPGGACGGDLSGTFPNCTVLTVLNGSTPVTKVNGNSPNASGAVTLNTLTGTYPFASLPTATAGNLASEYMVTDLGPGGSAWWPTYDYEDAAYENEPKNGQFIYQNDKNIYALPSSGSFANNGVVTLTTALDKTYNTPGIWLSFPAGAIASGSLANVYPCVMTGTTAGTCYNNPLYYLYANLPAASGVTGQTFWVKDCSTATCTAGSGTFYGPVTSNGTSYSLAVQAPYNMWPASLTAFATTGPGAYTQTTGSFIALAPFQFQGGVMGTRGTLALEAKFTVATSANNKLVGSAWSVGLQTSTGNLSSTTQTTNTYVPVCYEIQNVAGTAALQWQLFSTACTGASTGQRGINNTASESIRVDQVELTNGADYIIEMAPQAWIKR